MRKMKNFVVLWVFLGRKIINLIYDLRKFGWLWICGEIFVVEKTFKGEEEPLD